jgi:hypothetical protein
MCRAYMISSYIPTISSLLTARRSFAPIDVSKVKMLLAAAPAPPDRDRWPKLPSTVTEVKAVADVVDSVSRSIRLPLPAEQDVLDGPNGDEKGISVPTLVGTLGKAEILHLACHGYQNPRDALASGFALSDEMLTIAQLMREPLPRARIAFLSACNTAKGDADQPDQAVHLATTMLFAGFKSVIATLL